MHQRNHCECCRTPGGTPKFRGYSSFFDPGCGCTHGPRGRRGRRRTDLGVRRVSRLRAGRIDHKRYSRSPTRDRNQRWNKVADLGYYSAGNMRPGRPSGQRVVYITQGVVDTKNTPSTARGVLRTTLNPNTGALLGGSTYIATTAGLDGNQPTAAAIGPDGNLYVGFLKNGNVKRIVSPATGSTQSVQSVGNTPQGHSARAFAFVGNDIYIASIDALSVIHDAVSLACQGGCNAEAIPDGFAGVAHTGIASDGVGSLYFAVAGNPLSPGSNQIWRMLISNGTFTFVAMGGVDRNGANASNFSFAAAKTNLLTLDAGGNLWIGDDTSNAAAIGAGRLWTIPASALGSLTGSSSGGTNVQAIFNVLHGPWIATLTNTATSVTTQFVPSFNPDGTFTGVLTTTSSNPVVVTTDSGAWTLTAPNRTQPFANPQAHLTITDSAGTVLFSNDVLLETVDTFTSLTSGPGSLGSGFEVQWTKFAP